MPQISELLRQVSDIRKKHELIAEMTGERFNVFSILGLQTREVRTHSAFLRELLDPKGSHGLKDAFLKAFVQILKRVHGEGAHLGGWSECQSLSAKVDP